MLNELLNDVVLDYNNPEKIYRLAREYDRLESGAAAAGFYLRAADMTEGNSLEERWLQYKCMILMAKIYERNKNRCFTVADILKMAIETMPERPEAYYYLAKFFQDREGRDHWVNSLSYSRIGIETLKNESVSFPLDDDIEYPGHEYLKLLYARARWKTDGRDASKNLAFDLKYKNKNTLEFEKQVDELLAFHGYPSTLEYNPSLIHRLRYRFKGYDSIEKNYSRHFQDIFVLAALDGKRKGTFIELGSGHPELFNNTLLLEKKYGWKGISIDNYERMCYLFSTQRSSTVIMGDAGKIDYESLFKAHCLERSIDFLRINAETASIEALKKIPFNKYNFNVIQFQHNVCWWGDEFRKESRNILSKIGYILMVPDVAIDESGSAYEDWWVHPNIASKHKEMARSVGPNFAWKYMMEDL